MRINLLSARMPHRSRGFFTALLTMAMLFMALAGKAQLYYVTSDGTGSSTGTNDALVKVNTDGTSNNTIKSSLQNAPGLVAADLANNRIFVVEQFNKTIAPTNFDNAIKVISTTDGSLIATITTNNTANVPIVGIKYDAASGYIYYLTSDGAAGSISANDAIWKVKPDGTNLSTVVGSVTGAPSALAIDIANNRAYVFDHTVSANTLKVVNLSNGSSTSIGFGTVQIVSMDFDVAGGKLYYLSSDGNASGTSANDSFGSTDADGSNGAPLLGSVAKSPQVMALDAGNKKAYIFEGTAVVTPRQIDVIDYSGVGTPTESTLVTSLTPVVTGMAIASPPILTTADASGVTSGGATVGGSVISSDLTVTERGIVYSSSNSTPTIADSKASNGSGTGAFSGSISGLNGGTLYYFRAYATSGAGTSYGTVKSFTTLTASTTISSLSATATITKAASITYTATFAASVSGLDVDNFSVTPGGSVTGASVSSVSGSGTSWTITVNTGSGDGTVQLAMANSNHLTPTVSNVSFSGTTVTVDKTAPTISIGSPSASLAAGGPVSYTVTYSDANFNSSTLSSGNVTINSVGTANATAVISGSGTTRTVTLSGITGNGTLGISIAPGTASDLAGNTAPSAGASTTFTVDNIAPSVSISAPSVSTTAGGPVSYTVTYSDPYFNSATLATGDITQNSTGTANASTVVISGSGNTRTVTLSDITGDGPLGISIAAGTASDNAGNTASSAGPSTTFTVDNTGPTVTSITQQDGNTIQKGAQIDYSVTFSEPVTGVDNTDFTGTTTGVSGGTISVTSVSSTVYNISITNITGDGTYRLDLKSSGTGITDAAGNAISGGFTAGDVFTIDNIAPTIAIGAPSVSSIGAGAGDVTYTVTYADANFNSSTLATGDITLNTGGSASASMAVTGSGTTRTVTLSSITGAGTLGISIAAGTASDMAGNTAPAAGPSATFNVLSSDAGLSNLTATTTLSPAFDSGTISYTATGQAGVFNYTVTPTVNEAHASVEARINSGTYATVISGSPSGTFTLNTGANTIDVRVTAQDGTTQKTYTVTVTKYAVPVLSYGSAQTYYQNTAISTLAPSSNNVGTLGYGGNVSIANGASTPAVNSPTGVAVDATSGIVYEANNRYGSGSVNGYPSGFSYSSGFNTPFNISTDPQGNIYVADLGLSSIKKITPAGVASNIGSGLLGSAGVGADAAGNTYIANNTNESVYKVTSDGTQTVIASGFGNLYDVAVDGIGNVYASDVSTGTIFKIPAGTSTNLSKSALEIMADGLQGPISIAVDASGNIYASEALDNTVTMITSDGNQTTIGSGYAGVFGIGADNKGNVYVADNPTSVIYHIKPGGAYYITPMLPAGLSFNSSTGQITGTPTVLSPATDYTITAYNGNESATATVNIAIVPAVTTISSIAKADASPTKATTVNYTVTFAASVSGLTASNFTLTKTGTANGTIGTPTGSGTTWNVPVTSVSGTGNLTLNLDNATGLTPGISTTLPFAGEVYAIDNTAPGTTITSISLSDDTGISNTDFITQTAAQTISGTLSANLAADEIVEVSINNGANWNTATATVGDNHWSYATTFTSSDNLRVRVTDAVGNSGTVLIQSYVLDTTAPATTIASASFSDDTGTSSTDFITKTAAQTISGTLSANLLPGDIVQVSLDNGSTWSTATASVGDNHWSLAATLTGSNTFKVRVTDPAGNSGTAFSQAYTLDTTAPTVNITSDKSALKIGETAAITFTFSEDPSSTFTWDGSAGDITVTGGTLSAISGTGLTRTATFTPTANTNNGTASITVAAAAYTDAAGNDGGAGTTPAISFDTQAPTVTITSNKSALKIGETATITFTFSEDPGSSFTWDGSTGDVTVTGGTLSAISGSGLTRTATFTPTASTNNGTASITIAAASYTDAAGNDGEAGTTPAINFDTQAPTVAITSNKANLKGGETATITFTFSEDPGSSFTWDGSTGDVTVTGGTLGAISGSGLTRTATFTPTASTNSGTASITIAAASYTDAAGNDGGAGTTPAISFDTQAPTVTITSNKSALKIGETATITFTFSEDPGSSFTWDGSTGDITVTGGTLSAISGSGLTRTATFTPTANTNNGTASITVAAAAYTDAAGNDGGAGTTPAIGFDTKAPDAPSAPAISGNPSTITINNPTFTGTAEAGATVTLYDTDGTTVLGTATATGGTWSITSSALADISHTVKATATDAAGNTSVNSAGTTFTVNTAPTITATGTLTSMSTTYGIASAEQTITVSGTNLTEGIKVTAPSGFEVSTDNSSYLANVTVGAAGTVSATTVYVRLAATTPAGPYNGNVAASSTGATTVNVATNATNTVNKATASITLSNLTPTYDGTAKTATATTNPASLSGVTITYGGSATAPTAANTYAVVASLNNANYTATDATDNLVISPKTLTITAIAANKGYDGTADATVTLSDDRVTGDTFTTNYTAAFNNKNQGTGKTVNITSIAISGGASANYTLGNTTTTATADIAQKAINVTAQTDTKIYDGSNTSLVVPVTDALASGDVIATNPAQTFDNKNQGTGKTLTAAGLIITDGNSGNNYVVHYVTNTSGQISAKDINVTAQTDTKIYDGNTSSSVVPVTDALASGDVIATAPTQTFDNKNQGTGKTLTAAGLVITDGNSGHNYAVHYVTNTTGKITAKDINVTAQTDTKTYDGNNTSLMVPVTDALITGDVIATAPSQTFDNKNVGTGKTLTATGLVITDGNSGNNYAVHYVTNTTGKINPAVLTYVATTASRKYGVANPSFTGTTTGYLGSDTQGTATTGTLTFISPATTASPVGNYAINGSGLSAGNYTFVQATANATALSITPATLTVKADDQSKTYGSANPALTASYTGFVNGDTKASLTTQPTIITTATSSSPVNTYPITASGAASANYTISYTPGVLTVTNATLTITADDQDKVYGQVNPTLTASYSGFVNGEGKGSLTTQPTLITAANTASAAGSYPITASGAAIPNYSIVYHPGNLAVTKATLKVTADNASRNYGDGNPALTVSYSGFVNGDTQASLTALATASTTANETTAPGNYNITASGAASANYSFTYVNGTLTIIPLTNADLNNLTISAGTLSPAFDTGTFSYKADEDYTTASVTLTPTFDPTATVKINGSSSGNGVPSFDIPLQVGDNTLTVEVTAQDGVTRKTYTLTLYRGKPPVSITATNILTPNGDGKNDTWVIQDIQLYPNNSVSVYDRAGRAVYQKRKYNNEWDGTLAGVPLAQGTYYYTIDLGPGLPKIKGFITIIRSTN